MKTLVFATNNEHKLREVRAMMPPEIEVLGLSDLKCSDELPETSSSLEGNAMQKAHYEGLLFRNFFLYSQEQSYLWFRDIL